jgi:hypothetical protein
MLQHQKFSEIMPFFSSSSFSNFHSSIKKLIINNIYKAFFFTQKIKIFPACTMLLANCLLKKKGKINHGFIIFMFSKIHLLAVF